MASRDVASSDARLCVTEVFHALQGEGIRSGTPSVFVRLAGCPLRCRWCDTKYAWDYSGGTDGAIKDLVEQIGRWSCRHVVITGGEPLIGADGGPRAGLVDLTSQLSALGKHVTIETSGLCFVPDLVCDLMSISPKLANSTPSPGDAAAEHDRTRGDRKALSTLVETYRCQLKFVVESPADLPEIQSLLGQLPPIADERILLMPQATTREELLERAPMVANLCKETDFRFGHRLHVLLWNNRRGV
jgi:7-carboxy-7-deazaguanine synthase